MKKVIYKMIILILLISSAICFYIVANWYMELNKENNDIKRINEIANINSTDEIFTRNSWNSLKEKNSDLIGYIHTENNMINLPILQSKINDDYYLRRNYEKAYSTMGTPFITSDTSIEDQNITIYGHNVLYMKSAMFSPLLELMNQENYNQSKTFTIWWENKKVIYEITNVYRFQLSDQSIYTFQQRQFDSEDEFYEWINYANERNIVKTDNSASYNDELVTLNTCIGNGDTERLVIIGKAINEQEY